VPLTIERHSVSIHSAPVVGCMKHDRPTRSEKGALLSDSFCLGVLSRRPTCFHHYYCTQQFVKVGGHQKLAGALGAQRGSLFSAICSDMNFVRKS